MAGETNLTTLFRNMNPELQEEPFIFLTSRKGCSKTVLADAVMVFRESEGMTAIVSEEVAKTLIKESQPRWAMITLTIHSDLNAVGFMAAIATKLAAVGLSVNPVSAFYHDHLFVPWDRRMEAMEILRSFTA